MDKPGATSVKQLVSAFMNHHRGDLLGYREVAEAICRHPPTVNRILCEMARNGELRVFRRDNHPTLFLKPGMKKGGRNV